jgi:hypothetical protein
MQFRCFSLLSVKFWAIPTLFALAPEEMVGGGGEDGGVRGASPRHTAQFLQSIC